MNRVRIHRHLQDVLGEDLPVVHVRYESLDGRDAARAICRRPIGRLHPAGAASRFCPCGEGALDRVGSSLPARGVCSAVARHGFSQ